MLEPVGEAAQRRWCGRSFWDMEANLNLLPGRQLGP
jgi:hypothetical protein